MKYQNANRILPKELLEEVQKTLRGNCSIFQNRNIFTRNGAKNPGPGSIFWNETETSVSYFHRGLPSMCSQISFVFLPTVFGKSYILNPKTPETNLSLRCFLISSAPCRFHFFELFHFHCNKDHGEYRCNTIRDGSCIHDPINSP